MIVKILQQILLFLAELFLTSLLRDKSGRKPQRQAFRLWRGVWPAETASYTQIIVPLLETHFQLEKGVVR